LVGRDLALLAPAVVAGWLRLLVEVVLVLVLVLVRVLQLPSTPWMSRRPQRG
jgi:hypothetical protein